MWPVQAVHTNLEVRTPFHISNNRETGLLVPLPRNKVNFDYTNNC